MVLSGLSLFLFVCFSQSLANVDKGPYVVSLIYSSFPHLLKLPPFKDPRFTQRSRANSHPCTVSELTKQPKFQVTRSDQHFWRLLKPHSIITLVSSFSFVFSTRQFSCIFRKLSQKTKIKQKQLCHIYPEFMDNYGGVFKMTAIYPFVQNTYDFYSSNILVFNSLAINKGLPGFKTPRTHWEEECVCPQII